MAAKQVEWVLVVHYGPEAHHVTYGRKVGEGGYTKDYIQLSRRAEFLEMVRAVFSVSAKAQTVPLIYRWPAGQSSGDLVFRSADRPHLKWGTGVGAPRAWRMTPKPSDTTPETIPGDPTHTVKADADNELALLGARGAGQPYLLAIKLQGEVGVLHVRAYLANADIAYAWSSTELLPQEIQELLSLTSQKRMTAASIIQDYIVFDPSVNHDGWRELGPVLSDAAAEASMVDESQVQSFEKQIKLGSYEVADAVATSKTRGSAQRAFAQFVKSNYGWRCAVTGIKSKDYLVAAHIVPWSKDQTIRLDPANGICLSLIVDRAFEKGHIVVSDDLIIKINVDKIGDDDVLINKLKPFDGLKIKSPSKNPPGKSYLRRRRDMFK